MNMNEERKVVLVTRRTRLEELVARYHTLAQARFYIEHLGADFNDYLREHETYGAAKGKTVAALEAHGRFQVIERSFLPNFVFGERDIVIALGQDGVVANTMKYLDGKPLIGVNPDPQRFDGVLLPFGVEDVAPVVEDVARDHRSAKAVTMAEAVLSDGQRLLGVNDLFIGPKTHTSARYEIALGKQHEVQSSSGIIVSTGLGSSAWMRSIVTGAMAIAGSHGRVRAESYQPWSWDADYLQLAVREPFPSKSSSAELVYGKVARGDKLIVRSLMPEGGVIFSDGIEADYLAFTSGITAEIGVAAAKGTLIV